MARLTRSELAVKIVELLTASAPTAEDITAAEVREAFDDVVDSFVHQDDPQPDPLTHEERASIASVASPIRAVGLLQWHISPGIVEGHSEAVLNRTFRLQFESPYFPLTDYYFDVTIETPRQVQVLVHARRQWAQVTHLDVAISDTKAREIAGLLEAGDDHLEINIRYFPDNVTPGWVAATSRRVLLVDPDSDSGDSGTADNVARQAAARADAKATANTARIENEETTLGWVAVNPDRIDAAADLDGDYQCIVVLADAEVTRLRERGANYLEMWFGTEAVHVVSPWAPALATRVDVVLDTREETAIGGVGNVLPVRAIYRVNQGGGQQYVAEGSGALRIGGYNQTTASEPEFLTVEPAAVPKSSAGLQTPFRCVLHGLGTSARPGATKVRVTANGFAAKDTAWSAATDSDRVIPYALSRDNAQTLLTNVAGDDHIQIDVQFLTAANVAVGETLTFNLDFEIDSAVVNVVPYQANAVISRADGEVAEIVLTGNTTLNVTQGVNGSSLLVRVVQDAVGSRTLALAAGITRNGPAAPALSAGAADVDLLMFHRRGATWHYVGIVKDV